MIYDRLRQLLLGKYGNMKRPADIRYRIIKGTYSCKRAKKRKYSAQRHRRKWNPEVGNVVLIGDHKSGIIKNRRVQNLINSAIYSTEELHYKAWSLLDIQVKWMEG